MSDHLCEIRDVTLAGEPRARLSDVTLTLRPGVTALLGPSGSGKTSLLNLLVGFEKPDTGAIASRPSNPRHALPIFWSPANDGLWPHLTAREHLEAVVPQRQGQASAARVEAALSRFDLADRARARPDALSQGERSRLCVARALLADAAWLVMDEPLAHVDPGRVGVFWDVLIDMLRESGSSLVFSTHQPDIALAHAQHAVCLDAGRVTYAGPIDTLYHDPATPALAACLGDANWLTPREAATWLAPSAHPTDLRPTCCRPERLLLEERADGPLLVRDHRFAGSVAWADLEHCSSGQVRRFYHRPAGRRPAPGARVVLRLLLLLLQTSLFLTLAGCGGGNDPVIPVKSERHWPVPAEGAGVPRPRKMALGKDGEVIVLDTAARVLIYSADGRLDRQWKLPESKAGNPEGALLLKDGRIAVCDTHYYRILFYDQQGKVLGQFGQNGRGPGEFVFPVTLAQDDHENLYVCEYGGNDRIQKFTRDGQFLLSFASCGTAPGQLQRPSGMVWHEGLLYVADAINNRIQVFTDGGRFVRILGSPDRPLELRFPYDLALAPDATLLVIEWGAGRLTRIDREGTLLGRVGSPGNGRGQFRTPWGLTVDKQWRVRVADTENRRIVELQL